MSTVTRLTSAHLVGDPGRDRLQHVVGQPRPVGGHRVLGGDRAQHDRVAVGAAVALDADRADVGEQHHRELPDVAVEAGAGELLAGDRVGLAQDVEALAGDLADDPDAEAGAGERAGATRSRPAGRAARRPARTSSLNSVRSGSTSSNSRSSGRPPTLWWDLMLEVPAPPPDSTTSG